MLDLKKKEKYEDYSAWDFVTDIHNEFLETVREEFTSLVALFGHFDW